MGSGELHYWKLAMGGVDGGITIDASVATATATGLEAQMIRVRSAATFSVLTGASVLTSSSIDYLGTNVPTGVAIQPGLIFSGYGRHFTSIQITGGQITYYSKGDN